MNKKDGPLYSVPEEPCEQNHTGRWEAFKQPHCLDERFTVMWIQREDTRAQQYAAGQIPESTKHFGGNTIKGRFSSIFKMLTVEDSSSVFKKDGDRRKET